MISCSTFVKLKSDDLREAGQSHRELMFQPNLAPTEPISTAGLTGEHHVLFTGLGREAHRDPLRGTNNLLIEGFKLGWSMSS